MNSRPSTASPMPLNSPGSPLGEWHDTKEILQLQVGSSAPNGGSHPLPTHPLETETKHGIITANDCYPFSQMDQPAHSVRAGETVGCSLALANCFFCDSDAFCFLIYKTLFMVHLWFFNQVLIYCL